ncbi:M23 family metallopeptidase [Patescibacteria group bacterium]
MIKRLSLILISALIVLNSCSLIKFKTESPQPDSPRTFTIPPIENYTERVTKKPFGIKVSPDDSPVQPEKFTGFHTGVDFEIFENETDIDVDIFAICTGELILKRLVSGYGGVVMQKCEINEDDYTVLYGHLDLDSVEAEIGDSIKEADLIGVLGDGYSDETDGERKHLHLGIHKGLELELRGYVGSEEELEGWVDPLIILISTCTVDEAVEEILGH